MSKLLVVFGATGQQGGSIVETVLNDPELREQYKIRGITRDVSQSSSQSLEAKGVQMVKGDVNDTASLEEVLKDAHTVFLMTGATQEGITKEAEINQGKTATDAAIAAEVKYLIYSTLPHCSVISSGRFTGIEHFDSKAEIEAHIRGQPIKSAFFSPGSFMSNFDRIMAPRPVGDGSYAWTNCIDKTAQFPLIDTAHDTGKFVGAILANPDKYQGKVFCAATKMYSMEDIVRIMSDKSGKTVKYNQAPFEAFKSRMPQGRGEELVQMLQYHQDIGYYGPQSAELVAWAVENARGKPTTLEEYFARQPLQLN